MDTFSLDIWFLGGRVLCKQRVLVIYPNSYTNGSKTSIFVCALNTHLWAHLYTSSKPMLGCYPLLRVASCAFFFFFIDFSPIGPWLHSLSTSDHWALIQMDLVEGCYPFLFPNIVERGIWQRTPDKFLLEFPYKWQLNKKWEGGNTGKTMSGRI